MEVPDLNLHYSKKLLMKKLLGLLAICIALASCSEDPAFLTNEMLDGNWQVTSYFIDNENVLGDNALISEATYAFAMGQDTEGRLTIAMTTLGKKQEEVVDYVISGNDGNVITITNNNDETYEGTITAGGDVFTLEYFNDEGKKEIIEANKL